MDPGPQVYSRVYSRPFRVAVVATSTLVLMFTNALLYSLLYPEVRLPSVSASS